MSTETRVYLFFFLDGGVVLNNYYPVCFSFDNPFKQKERKKKTRPTTFGPGALNPSDPGRSPHLRDGTRRARDATTQAEQWVDSTPAVAMAAAGWPLSSSVADLLPASLSLTLLLASLVHPRSPPNPLSPLYPLPRATYPFSPLPCAGGRRGAGRRRLLLRAHPQDRMHALVSDSVTPPNPVVVFAHGDLRACGCLTGVLFLDLGRLQAGEDRSLGLVLRGPQLAQQGKRGILFTHFKLSIPFPGCSECECCAR